VAVQVQLALAQVVQVAIQFKQTQEEQQVARLLLQERVVVAVAVRLNIKIPLTIPLQMVLAVALVVLDRYCCITKMWAIVDKKTNLVKACVHNEKHQFGHSYEWAKDYAGEDLIVEMTLENSPAYIDGYYDGVKFHPREEVKNG
jgi:hypothetical protein